MYLLDTNICIYIIKKHPVSVIQAIQSKKAFEIKISSITIAELEYGISKSSSPQKNRLALLNFVSAFEILFFDDLDARFYGEIRAALEAKGQTIGPYDLQIAAQAISKDLILVTNNVREFKRIPNLKIENWV